MNKMIGFGVALALLAVAAVYLLSGAEEQVAGHVEPNTSALPEGAPIVEVALPAQLSSEAQMGQRVFEAKCAVCHGENAAGQNGVAPPLVHKIYEPGHHSDMSFVLAAKNGVRAHHWRFGNMPPVEGVTDADMKYVARYVRELQKENGIF